MKKAIMAVTEMDKPISDLAKKTDHKALAIWAADCAERVLPFFEEACPEDDRPRRAIEACREWVRTGVFHMRDVRGGALAAHAAARETAEGSAARCAARSAGHALATAHVRTHAIAAAIYAATAVRDAASSADVPAVVLREREWQYRRLLQVIEAGENE